MLECLLLVHLSGYGVVCVGRPIISTYPVTVWCVLEDCHANVLPDIPGIPTKNKDHFQWALKTE